MNTQTMSPSTWSLPAGRAQRLGAGIGELTVLEGRVWVTGRDGEDHVLSRGERMRIADAGQVVVESWERSRGAVLRWQPRRQGLPFVLRGLLGGFFAAFARRAASSASRPQGCM
ncbi:MAG: DUF2917 domain-containing protein [Piscinibacter sp.]|nr:DUF2917 domain-containing protein [Piscinibacter sp.]